MHAQTQLQARHSGQLLPPQPPLQGTLCTSPPVESLALGGSACKALHDSTTSAMHLPPLLTSMGPNQIALLPQVQLEVPASLTD